MDRSAVIGIAALFLVQYGGDAPGLPVVEQAFHVGRGLLLALDEDGLVADFPLLPGNARHLLVHHFGADLHVAHGVETESLGVAFPDRDAVRHESAHGRLVVVVADDSARNARGTRGDTGLVDDQNVAATAAAGSPQGLAQMPGG